MSGSREVIRVEQVSKSFGGRSVLNGVSFSVASGKACCILGRSGTGKSVTLKLLMGLLQPDNGRIYIEDRDITKLKDREIGLVRLRMGFLFQNAALFDSITVGENVAFPLRRHTRKSEKEIQESVYEKLAAVGLQREIHKMPVDLSGGMKKRAGLARALALGPSILLVDEPSAGLDPITTSEIDELLIKLKTNAGTTVVVVTHNIPSARRIGDELIVLHEGRIIAQGTAQELDQTQHELVADFMNSSEGG